MPAGLNPNFTHSLLQTAVTAPIYPKAISAANQGFLSSLGICILLLSFLIGFSGNFVRIER
jgi:hypothetical protein